MKYKEINNHSCKPCIWLQKCYCYSYILKAFSLAGCRVGYAIANKELINYLDNINDSYPLFRSAEAAAIESLNHIDKINERVLLLKKIKDLISSLKTRNIFFPTETCFN